jgi:hypothetical protein
VIVAKQVALEYLVRIFNAVAYLIGFVKGIPPRITHAYCI